MNTKKKTKSSRLVDKFDSLSFAQKVSISVVAFSLGAIGLVSIGAAQESYSCNSEGETVVVTGGANNTLWAIAHRYCKGSIARAVDAMVDEYGAELQIGQIIVLPKDESKIK
jgi:hypothetical protein